MIKTFILILVFQGGQGYGTMITQEFSSRDRCEAALIAVKQSYGRTVQPTTRLVGETPSSYWKSSYHGKCVEK